jgi:hypothetical protein
VKRYEPPAGWTVQAYRFALEPSDAQVLGLRRNTGAARFAYNHMLRRVSAVQAQRAAEASYEVAEADLTPWQGWSLPDLRRTWNEIKQWVAPWWAECSKEAFNTGLANLSAALGNWHASRTGTRKGRRMGWPRTKKKHGRRSARFTTGAIRVDPGYRHVVLPRLGRIRTHESTRKLARRVRAGTATILSATVAETAGRWFCSFQVAVGRTVGRPAHAPKAGPVVGVDAGIKHLAVLSTGEMVAEPGAVQGRVAETRQGPTPGRPADRPLRPAGQTQTDRVEPVAAGTGRGGPAARHSLGRPRRLVAPTHHPPGAAVHRGRGRGPPRGRDGPQPQTVQIPDRRRPGDAAPAPRLQDQLVRQARCTSPTGGTPAPRRAPPARR